MQWTEECVCNSGRPNFDLIEFSTNSSRIEILCGKCHCVICWWPISIVQVMALDKQRIKEEKSVVVHTRTK